VIVDSSAFFKFQEDESIDLTPLKSKTSENATSEVNDHEGTLTNGDSEKKLDLSKEQLLICKPTVRGYSLTAKKWGINNFQTKA